jgi:hypothetical protein
MNEINHIKRLDAVSAGGAPEIDVADGVLRRIRTERIESADAGPMWIGAIVSTLAAAAVLLVAVQTFTGLQDPFGDLLTPLWTAFR